jgi:hypothetical protein
LATRIAHMAVRYQLVDEALRVWGEKALGIPRDAQPTSKRSIALHYGTDTPVGNLHRGRHDRGRRRQADRSRHVLALWPRKPPSLPFNPAINCSTRGPVCLVPRSAKVDYGGVPVRVVGKIDQQGPLIAPCAPANNIFDALIVHDTEILHRLAPLTHACFYGPAFRPDDFRC